ncbi:MAG: DASH family cryptochrome [Gammaproteobacteria bacterium]|nr:DASH family cryptochrome [Gammaproteobacteria bacterium]MBU1505421.1 DASH family cryptochrome [Gammaproteobacteria bacterium]MBU2123207.1 DASH family cryptochrome [Gammaproteobacteria bacterium]MBU2170653.1 DASH family cryptochrome [Gammaproteobacteria bacterium]MBU2199887.1 DASH family cryptochrome [Gammaproteobacteria bacterium]
MSTVLFWFRNDVRLHDQPALQAALASGATHLLPVVCLPPADESTPWGFARVGSHRRAFVAAALRDLGARMAALGNPLQVCHSAPATALPVLARAGGATTVVCEDIAAPYEQAEVAALRAAGLQVRTVWHSSLLSPAGMPWPAAELPAVFTPFRQAVERARLKPPAPLRPPTSLLPPPRVPPDVWRAVAGAVPAAAEQGAAASDNPGGRDPRSSFPYGTPACDGGEAAALAHLAQYLTRKLPHSYKATRNGLTGLDYSSKFSPWLATGALSPRQVYADLKTFEGHHGANDGSYWLWFELLWRDYFRLLRLQYGAALYRGQGLSALPLARHNAKGFERWCRGHTGEPLVDAAMRELAATGTLSNRLRQVVASFLIYDLHGDWRAGAAWFESQLVDYDVYSNQGNWLYIAGRGTDPRGGRRFNPAKQAQDHDADGSYRRMWGTL